ncbi:MAG: DUF4349 domain-containing protein [Candidatus Omnitrophica bacterium]|nr:DUF4349 domain-containing protein [Candidatus Omnitrophota bacterium]
MNKCHINNKLSRYLDNELPEKEKIKVAEHLKTCLVCSDELERLKAVSEKLRIWHAPDLKDDFDAHVRNTIVARELERGAVKMKKKTWAVLIPSGALAGILVFVLVVGSMQSYIKRGLEGRLRLSGDEIGEEYSPSYDYGKASPKQARKMDISARQKANDGKTAANYFNDKFGVIEGKDYAVLEGGEISNGVKLAFKDAQYEPYYLNSGNLREDAGEKTMWAVYSKAETPVTPKAEGPVIVIQPSLPATGVGNWIIRTATVRLEVENGREAYGKISQLCQDFGGYLANSNFYEDRDGLQSGSVTLRIPKDKFTVCLDKLGTLGKVEDIQTNSQDVSQQYTALKSQLDAAMVVYNKMLEALQKRQVTIPEAVRLESELTPVLRRVEELKNHIEQLNNSVSFTTINVNFHETGVSTKTLKQSVRYIKESLINAGVKAVKFIAISIPFAIAGIVFLGLAIIIILVVRYWIVKLFKQN